MTYVRKTSDEFRLFVNYGQGWEYEIAEESRKAIKGQAATYRANCPYPVRWSGPHRVRLAA